MEFDPNQQQQPSTNPVPVEPQSPQQSPHGPYSKRQGGGSKKKLILIIAAVVVALALVGAAVWFFLLRDNKKSDIKQTNNTPTQQQAEDLPAATEADSTPVTFKSTKLNLELTHRKDWTLKEGTGGDLTITSPRISYSRVDGTAGSGVFTLKLRKGATEAMKATIEKAVAVRNSEVIAYTAPTDAQRHYTNISWAGQEAAFNFFIVTGSTEIKDGQPFAYTLAFDNETYLIAGGYGTDKDGSLSFDAVPKTAIDSAAKDQAIDIVESIKLY
jgi:cbb3-type cytochrome oxidase subunit 3